MEQCSKMLRVGLDEFPCSRKGAVERDGKPYCRQHDPVAVSARHMERTRRLRERWKAEQEECEAEAREAHLISASPDMYEALKRALEDLEEWHTNYFQDSVGGIHSQAPCDGGCETCEVTIPAIKAAIAKAEGVSK